MTPTVMDGPAARGRRKPRRAPARSIACCLLAACLASHCAARALLAEDSHPEIELWPGAAPDETQQLPAEADTTKPSDHQVAGRSVIRLGNVSRPTITIYRPEPQNDTGAAVLVCPGGAYHILALDLEGTEVCEWLNSIGVTGVLLKYRVPRREGREKHAAPLQDAQRAMGLLRELAAEIQIDPHRLGVLGFSAGGHLAAALSTNNAERTYSPIDSADQQSCRPDFSLLIYPGYLVDRDKDNAPVAELPVTKDTPPMFLVMAQDDGVGVENVLGFAQALHHQHVPVEAHIYPVGGHGYGLRATDLPVTSWPARATDWMRSQGWLAPSKSPS